MGLSTMFQPLPLRVIISASGKLTAGGMLFCIPGVGSNGGGRGGGGISRKTDCACVHTFRNERYRERGCGESSRPRGIVCEMKDCMRIALYFLEASISRRSFENKRKHTIRHNESNRYECFPLLLKDSKYTDFQRNKKYKDSETLDKCCTIY